MKYQKVSKQSILEATAKVIAQKGLDKTSVDDIIKEVNGIFIDVLDNDAIVLKYETTAKDIEEWDSLTHVQLVVAIEKHFKIRFKSSEIQGYKNVGEMCEGILAYTGK